MHSIFLKMLYFAAKCGNIAIMQKFFAIKEISCYVQSNKKLYLHKVILKILWSKVGSG